jgi:hypothetical protein
MSSIIEYTKKEIQDNWNYYTRAKLDPIIVRLLVRHGFCRLCAVQFEKATLTARFMLVQPFFRNFW